MRRRSFASEGRFAAGEPEGCASIREFGNSCDTRRAEMKFLCAFVPLCGKKKKRKLCERKRETTHTRTTGKDGGFAIFSNTYLRFSLDFWYNVRKMCMTDEK